MANTYNFNAGPGALPAAVLQEAKEELQDYQGLGASILEISHRSPAYGRLHHEAQQLIKDMMGLSTDYEVLFLHGGASLQFSMVPMNFLTPGKIAGYIHSGTWSKKAWQEAQKIGSTVVLASGARQGFKQMPDLSNLIVPGDAAYIHLTSNETIDGIQCKHYPDTGSVPLIVDMSSDIFSAPVDASRFSLIYAGAQKNLGPAGVTIVIVHRAMLADIPTTIPDILSYRTHVAHDALYNTPPVFAVYMVNRVLKWIMRQGGVEAMAAHNQRKADLLYRVLDHSGGFYTGLAHVDSRSMMNVTFRTVTPALDKKLLAELEQAGFIGLKGHRDAGHFRASIYNAVPYAHCQALAEFLIAFQERNEGRVQAYGS